MNAQGAGERVLVVTYGHAADVIAAIPGLRSLRRELPKARLEVLVLDSVAPLVARLPYVDEAIVWRDFDRKGQRGDRLEKAARLTRLAVRIRARRYTAVLVFHRSFGFTRRLAALSGAQLTAGVGPGFTHSVDRPLLAESSRDENRRVLEAIGIVEDGELPELVPSIEEDASARRLLADVEAPVIGLHPGSDWSCQQWLPERFAEVARLVRARLGATVVITGSAAERGLQDEIAGAVEFPVVRLAGRTTLGELTSVVRRLDVLVSVNSAAVAIAKAVETPVVVLLGNEDARYTGAVNSRRLRVVQATTPVAGWCEFGRWGVRSGCESPMCRGLGGLNELTADAVLEQVLDLFERVDQPVKHVLPEEVAI